MDQDLMRRDALRYIKRGWRVFPVHGLTDGHCSCERPECSSPGKHPLTRHGLYDATTDADNVKRWFDTWPHANIAIATGRESDLVVVDIDLPKAEPSLVRLEDLGRALPETLAVLTGGGGRHLYFSHPHRPIPNTSGRLPGIVESLPGLDVRSGGGYVVAPPSLHISSNRYEWKDPGASIKALPDWFKEPERAPLSALAAGPADYTGDGSAYGLYVLGAELSELRAAVRGTRNHTLNRSAFAVAQVVAGGELDEHHARSELLETAVAIGLPEPESRQTLDSAFRAGAREPRSAPHRL
jgi:hypothetical protein